VHNRIDHDEYKRWLDQAEYTLQSARRDLEAGDFTWSCFKAQQAAEYAVKSVLRGLGRLASGHSVLKLLMEIEQCGFDIGVSRYRCDNALINEHACCTPEVFIFTKGKPQLSNCLN